MPLTIQITDADIEAIESSLGWPFGDSNRSEALRCTTSRDIQACPGSGKTTLLVAKLAILASKWPWRDQGICVLSHTNVARYEVEERLASHPAAHRLLDYPHFVGTIQCFVDRFLALPFLRNQGRDICRIDDAWFERGANRLLNRYHAARVFVLKRHTGGQVVRQLRYSGPSLILGSGGGSIPVGHDTRTYREFQQLKDALALAGTLRFDDMYAYAEAYLDKCPAIVRALRRRFPWVFVDEMQDTDATQDRLLQSIFREGCVLQRFGDINQAIFRGGSEVESQSSFPTDSSIDIPESKRFGTQIASLATPLCAIIPQILIGDPTRSPRRHSVFLFNGDTIQQVLPAFASHVLAEFDGHLPRNFVAKAVGFRKSAPSSASSRIPTTIADYWDGFQSDFTVTSGCPRQLVDFVHRARHSRAERSECCDAYAILVEGVLQFLHTQGAIYGSGLRFTRPRLFDMLEKHNNFVAFQRLLVDLCLSREPVTSDYWANVLRALRDIMSPWTTGALTPEATAFLEWRERPHQLPSGLSDLPTNRMNVFQHHGVPIEVATIHSVKGETHDATLVLETFWHTHDLKALLPFLKGEGDNHRVQDSHLVERMKRVYVAMTRPRDLLCIAMHKENLGSGDVEALERRGWRVDDLTLS